MYNAGKMQQMCLVQHSGAPSKILFGLENASSSSSSSKQLGLKYANSQEGSLTRQASKERRARVKVMTLDREAVSSTTKGIVRLTHSHSEPIKCKHSSATQACTIQQRFNSCPRVVDL